MTILPFTSWCTPEEFPDDRMSAVLNLVASFNTSYQPDNPQDKIQFQQFKFFFVETLSLRNHLETEHIWGIG